MPEINYLRKSEARAPAERKRLGQELFSEVPHFGMVSLVLTSPTKGRLPLPSTGQRVTVILRRASMRPGRGGWVLNRAVKTCPGLKGATIYRDEVAGVTLVMGIRLL